MTFKFNASKTCRNLTPSKGRKIAGIVLHDTAGNGGIGDVNYLAEDPEKRHISVDFAILKDGAIYKLNPDIRNFYTNHAGRSTRFKSYANAQVNRATIGIEICQKANMTGLNPPYPEVQIRAVSFTCAHLAKEFKLGKEDITTHKQIITDGTRSDPRSFPFNDFWKYYNEYMTGAFESPKAADSLYHVVVAGDTLYALARRYGTTIERLKSLNSLETASTVITVNQKLLIRE